MKRPKMLSAFLHPQPLDIIPKKLPFQNSIHLNCHHHDRQCNYHKRNLVPSSWWYFIIIMFAIGVNNYSTVNALRCYCNPHECDVIRSRDCPGKGFTVWDPCKCCRMCARTLGEACGGPGGFSGTCEPPLQCVAQLPLVDGLGVCTDLPKFTAIAVLNCTKDETIDIDAGCEIANSKCQCWPVMNVCRDYQPLSGRWHFRTLEDCQLNLQNLIKTEMEFDEDYTVSPRSFTYRKVRGKRRRVRRRYFKN